ncbi:SDR family NAD(P)-dependent oxidoreductase [Nocardia fluminea]|uniref:SDR family NAD(P)-dependent oxidoreductase n=1 Tax=Nocardia fluminea TaxID=134984 RepID=UPI003405057E
MNDHLRHSEDPAMTRRLADNPVAIVGLSGLFPMAANFRDFWQNVVDAADCMSDVPATHWNLDDYYDADPTAPDKTYCRRGGFVPEMPFSVTEFGLPPNQLEVTTVVQLLSLLVARDVLADAGAVGSDWYRPERTGVVLGVAGPTTLSHPLAARLSTPVLKEVIRSCGLTQADAEQIAQKYADAFPSWEENSFPGLLGNVIAGRVANRLDLGGMNCTVDAACASSLSAVHVAISELVSGRADMMITGGCDTENSIFGYLCFSKVGALSRSGVIKPLDDSADGTLVGEGIGMIALKRLADAERDGDRVYAVIKGIGSSSDGRFKSIYAPRAEGQQAALHRAYEDADCSPATIGLFEAHATGTRVGDQTELAALNTVLRAATDETGYAAIGSVKSQIGHTKGAAGAASLIKLALALHHKVLPPTINVTAPNKALDDSSPLYINTRTRPWIRDPHRPQRRAAASAMGFGGTNFHAILEEAGDERGHALTMHRTARVHLWHAASAAELASLLSSGAAPNGDAGIPAEHARVGFVARDDEEASALRALAVSELAADADEWIHPRGIVFRRRAVPDLKIGALFAGQGSQYVDMGLAAVLNNPTVATAFDEANAVFADAARPPASVVFPAPVFDPELRNAQEATLRRTEFAQPAIAALSVGQYRFLSERGLTCEGFMGHSFGELTALWAVGSLDAVDYFTLARARGAAMAIGTDADAGTMAAVQADREQVNATLAGHPDVSVCNHNAPDQVVVGGGTAAVAEFVAAGRAQGLTVRELPVAGAFHTRYVAHAVEPFKAAVKNVAIRAPKAKIYANSRDAEYGARVATNRRVLTEQLLETVEFVAGLRAMRADGCNVFVEFGPKATLTSLVRRTLGADVIALSTDQGPTGDSDVALKKAALHLAVLGAPIVDIHRHDAAPFAVPEAPGMVVRLNGRDFVPESRKELYRKGIKEQVVLEAVTQAREAAEADAAAQAQVVAREHAAEQERVAAEAHTAAQAEAARTHAAAQTEVAQTHVPTRELVSAEAPAGAQVRAASGAGTRTATGYDTAAQQHLDIHSRYAQGQLEVAEGLVSVLRDAQRTGGADDRLHATVHAIKEQSLAIGRTHVRVNEILASLSGLELDSPGPTVDAATTNGTHGLHAELPTGNGNGNHTHAAALLDHRTATAPTTQPESAAPQGNSVTTSTPDPQLAHATSAPRPIDTETAPLAATPGAHAVTDAPVLDAEAVWSVLSQVVSDKTGYPPEMLALSLDLEADLGVDSIKRVQIMGAVGERIDGVPAVGPEQVAELRTLSDIVDFVAASTVSVPGVATASESVVDADAVWSVLSQVVSEKTGYPPEMLALSLDLEADLGVDSIKRVQIMGAVGERIDGVPAVGPEQVAELRTLSDIVDFVAGSVATNAAPVVGSGSEAAPTGDRVQPGSSRDGIEDDPVLLRIVPVALPDIDRLAQPYAAERTALIVDHGDNTAATLATGLEQQGWTVRTAAVAARDDAGVAAWDGATVQAAIESALKDVVRLDLCLTVLPADSQWLVGGHRLADTIHTATLVHDRLVATAEAGTRAAFVTLTRIDGVLGHHGERAAAAAVVGGVSGLVKTLAQEAPGLFCRAVDLSPQLSDEALIVSFLAELDDAALDAREVGVDADRTRWTLRPQAVESPAPVAELALTTDDVLVVTGGARGVTARCVRELAARKPCEFLLLGRTELEDEPEWAAGVADDALKAAAIAAVRASGEQPTPKQVDRLTRNLLAQREIRATLDGVAETGARVRYLAVDITDAEATERALAPDAGRITGIVHGAGALADSLLPAKTTDDIRLVLATKLDGLYNVVTALRDATLGHIVLFGSVAGVYGNPGQADYAVANEALNRAAVSWRRQGLAGHVTTVNWGAWDGGMVTPQLREVFLARGVALLGMDAGARMFAEQFAPGRADDVSVLVGPAAPLATVVTLTPTGPFTAHRDLAPLAGDPVIGDHRVGKFPVFPAAAGLGWAINVLERANPGLRVVECTSFEVLRGIVYDGKDERSYRLEAQAGTVADDRLSVTVWIRSDEPGKTLAPSHFTGTFVLAAETSPAPVLSGWPGYAIGAGPEDGLDVYRAADLFHGPLLQGVRRILERGERRLVVEGKLPDARIGTGNYAGALHSPVLADVAIQAGALLGVWFMNSACLPLSIGRIEYFAALPDDSPFVLVVDDLRANATGTEVTVSVTACDPNGTVLQRYRDLAVIATPEMTEKFAEAVRLREQRA